MSKDIHIKGRKIDYQVVRKEGFSRIHFEMDAHGKIILTLPHFVPENKIQKVILENSQWILDELAKIDAVKQADENRTVLMIEGKEFEYEIKRKKVSRLTLKVNSHGEIILITPNRFPILKAKEFIESKKDWLKKVLNKYLNHSAESNLRKLFFKENKIFYRGERVPVRIIENKSLKKPVFRYASNLENSLFPESASCFEIQAQSIKDRPLLLKTALIGLRELAKNELKKMLDEESEKAGIGYHSLRVKEVKTRWGSCSSKKNINLCWRLIMAPVECQRYVVLHELCHIKELNHSKAFWDLVKSKMPEFKNYRNWLKKEGFLLYSF